MPAAVRWRRTARPPVLRLATAASSQNVQRLGLYAMDQWRVTPQLTINYGLRWDTTFGLFQASGVSQQFNPAVQTIAGLQLPLSDRRAARLSQGLRAAHWDCLFSRPGGRPGDSRRLRHVLQRPGAERLGDRFPGGEHPVRLCSPAPCPEMPGACRARRMAAPGTSIDPNYHTPYAIHASGGVQYLWHKNWTLSADYVYEKGVHSYRRYDYTAGYHFVLAAVRAGPGYQRRTCPNISVFKSDNRSSLQRPDAARAGKREPPLQFTANYVCRAPTPGVACWANCSTT